MVKSVTSTSSLERSADHPPSKGPSANVNQETVNEENSDLFIPDPPDVSHLITEDDTPVDNFASAKQQRLLVSSLYSSQPDRTFLAEANVGIFYQSNKPPIVPDVFVSYDVQVPDNWWQKKNRSYMVWNFGKAPEIIIEIVSNKVGNELTDKLEIYKNNLRSTYYVVYDPSHQLGDEILHVFELQGNTYVPLSSPRFGPGNLGVMTWNGIFEGREDYWLRWCDADGNILLTGDELARQEQQRANREQQRANRLAEFLRLQGVDPDNLPG